MRKKKFSVSVIYPFKPVFASLLKKRSIVLLLCSIVTVYLVLSSFGYQVWFCPIFSATGIRCPGCGLTHAVYELLHGNWLASFQQHAFAPFFLAGFVLMIIISLLPESLNQKCIAFIATIEQRTGFFFFLMILLVVYWFVRLGIELFH